MKLTVPKINYETLLCGLLFLFPLFALGVRHWASTTFSLIVLLGIVYYFAKHRTDPVKLHQYEKWLLWFLFAYFVVFMVSMIVNNPPETFGRTRFGNEIRFLLVIPLYFLLAKYQHGLRYLVAGSIGAIVIGFGFCIYELYVLGEDFFTGEYSKLFTGPVILMYLTLVLTYFIPKLNRQNKKEWFFLAALTAIATFSIISTEVRAAYITYLFISLMFLLFYIKGMKKIIVLVFLVASISVISLSSHSIKSRMTDAYSEFISFLKKEDPEKKDPAGKDVSYAGTSVGVRLEMWRVAPHFLRDYPILGVGNGNYLKTIIEYIEQGKTHPAMAEHDHPHNVFLNATYNKGLIGLLSTCLVFFFPLYVYFKSYKLSRGSALIGIFYITVIFFVSLNAVAPFFKSNFIATYLVFGMVIFQNHVRKIERA